MGWNLFLTNVPTSIWPPKALVAVYRLRWRIEIIFKTWKSHLGLRQLNCRTAALLQLSVLTKLLFCALVCQVCDVLELHCAEERPRQPLAPGTHSRTSALVGSPPWCWGSPSPSGSSSLWRTMPSTIREKTAKTITSCSRTLEPP